MLVPEKIESTELGLPHPIKREVSTANRATAVEEEEEDDDKQREEGRKEEEEEAAFEGEEAATADPSREVTDLEGGIGQGALGLVLRDQIAVLILFVFLL